MEVEYRQGMNAKTFESMDIESRCAVMDAVEQVRDKRGFEKMGGETGGERLLFVGCIWA